jgi:hypothetical protein
MKYYNYPDPRGTEVAEDVDSKNISNYASGGGGTFIVNLANGESTGTFVTDKTAKEIYDASFTGPVICILEDVFVCSIIATAYLEDTGYVIKLASADGMATLIASTDDATTWTTHVDT